jgi:hypothetical protein
MISGRVTHETTTIKGHIQFFLDKEEEKQVRMIFGGGAGEVYDVLIILETCSGDRRIY